jgi:hypothetical protein
MRQRLPICLMLIFALPCLAFGAELPVLQTKVRTLAVFKNGLGFAFRSGIAAPVDGWVDINETPPASLGTLWIGTTNALERVEEVIAYRATTEKAKDAQSVAELVDLNVGKTVSLTYWTGGSGATVRGELLSSAGQIVVIQVTQPVDARGKLAIKKDSIQTVGLGDDAVTKGKGSDVTNRAKARIAGKPKSAEITLAYLEKGITWSPSYLINIRDEKMADITLEAVLANDAEDLTDTDVSFVVGYPNFMFADITTPLSLQQSVASFVQALTYGRFSTAAGGAVAQSVAYNNAGGAYAGDSWRPELTYSATQPMAGESSEDFYLYKQPGVSLKKGERARYTVFTGKAPYEHVYELEVPDSANFGYSASSTSDRNARDDGPQVWHTLRLENTTQFPWTTAPALAVNGAIPVAQDTLKYTPPKGKNTLKLTIATDIRAQQEQTEAAREQVTIANRTYDRVTVNGKLSIRSYKAQPVKLSVRKMMAGEVKQSSDGGKALKLAKQPTALNPDSRVSWEFELAPGVEKVLTYQYTLLIYR